MTVLTKGLTDPHDPIRSGQLQKTYPGMAHLAGTGPEGKTCRECVDWGMPRASDGKPMAYRYRPFLEDGELCGRRCQKYHRLMLAGLHLVRGRAVPHHAPACRHFVELANPPAVNRQPRRSRKKALPVLTVVA